MVSNKNSVVAGELLKNLQKTSMFKLLFRRIFSSRSDADLYTNGKYRYSGSYLDGKAEYYYEISEDRRVYEGEFRFLRSYYNYPLGKTVDKAKGYFVHDRKDGHWIFSRKNKKVRKKLEIDYSKGLHNGKYVYTSVCRSRSLEVWNGATEISLSMRDGLPVGEIDGRFDDEIFTGYFDDEGRPDGKWMLDMSRTNSCVVEYEVWSHGSLKDSYSVNMSTGAKKESKIRLLEFIMNFIYGECRPMERLVKKGSAIWSGDIKYDK